jgi:hypothetical protein
MRTNYRVGNAEDAANDSVKYPGINVIMDQTGLTAYHSVF